MPQGHTTKNLTWTALGSNPGFRSEACKFLDIIFRNPVSTADKTLLRSYKEHLDNASWEHYRRSLRVSKEICYICGSLISRRAVSSSQMPLLHKTQQTQETNIQSLSGILIPQSQQSNGFKPAPGSAVNEITSCYLTRQVIMTFTSRVLSQLYPRLASNWTVNN